MLNEINYMDELNIKKISMVSEQFSKVTIAHSKKTTMDSLKLLDPCRYKYKKMTETSKVKLKTGCMHKVLWET